MDGWTNATPNPYRFGGAWGYITDTPGSGLLQLGHRYYWPELGRFIQQDPIGDGVNWYAYAGNNPLTGIDPEGLVRADDVYDALGNFLGGATDTLSFGLAAPLRRAFGVREAPDPCSGWYTGGKWTGVGLGIAAGGVGIARGIAGLGSRTLFRAVGEAELADIEAMGVYRIAGNAMEYYKPFFGSAKEALKYAALMQEAGYGEFTITSGRFSTGILTVSGDVGGEGFAYYIPEWALPTGPVSIIGPAPVP